jgi:hypothetical protein
MSGVLENIRKKYPEYNDINDSTLAKLVVAKYPEYESDLRGFYETPIPKNPEVPKQVEGKSIPGFMNYLKKKFIDEPSTSVGEGLTGVQKALRDLGNTSPERFPADVGNLFTSAGQVIAGGFSPLNPFIEAEGQLAKNVGVPALDVPTNLQTFTQFSGNVAKESAKLLTNDQRTIESVGRVGETIGSAAPFVAIGAGAKLLKNTKPVSRPTSVEPESISKPDLSNASDVVEVPTGGGPPTMTEVKAGNIRTGRFEQPAQQGIKDLVVNEPNNAVEFQRRGVQTHAETEAAARLQGETVARAKRGEVKPGEAFNAAQIEALDSELNRIGQLTPDQIANEPGVSNLLRTVHGAHAEGGRALNIMGKNIDPTVAQNFQAAAKLSKDPTIVDAVKLAADMLDKGQMVPPGVWHKVAEWGRNVKLLSVSSLVRSVVGNSVMQVFKYPETLTSAGYNKILSTLTGKSRDRFAREATADFVGTMSGARTGFTEAWKMIKEEALSIEESAFLEQEVGRHAQGAIGGTLGKVIRTPQRLQGAIDSIFRKPSEQGLIARYATRKALQEGLSGKALLERIDELIKTPTPDVISKVATDARYLTYQGKLGAFGGGINSFRLSHPLAQTLVPFFNTWANLFKAGVERTPFGVMTPEFLQAAREGLGSKKTLSDVRLSEITGKKFEPGLGRLSDKYARATVGSAFMATSGAVIFKAMDGDITGRGPRTPQERDALERTGWKPYSLKIGDTYYSYRGFEPLSTWLGVMSDASQGLGEEGVDEAISRSTKNIARNFADNQFMIGIKDAVDVLLGDKEASAERAIAGFAVGMMVPTIAQQVGGIIDPVRRKSEGIGESVMIRIPGLSKDLIPQRDIFGRPIITERPGLRLIAGNISTEKIDPTEKELQRLKLNLGWPSDTYAGIKLTPQEEDKLVELSGKQFKKVLDNMVKSEMWDQLTDGVKVSAIQRAQNLIREIHRATLFPGATEESLLQKMDKNLTGGSISPEDKEKTMDALRRATQR